MRSIQDRKAASAVQKLRSNARREPLSESFTHAIRILGIPLVERWALVLAKPKAESKRPAGRSFWLSQKMCHLWPRSLSFPVNQKKIPALIEYGDFPYFNAWQWPTLTWGNPTLPSALSGFTSEFEMGSGGSRSLWSSGNSGVGTHNFTAAH